MNELVSIIIPIYNAEDNISKCIESILNQTYSNIEVLCINDGSKDNSKEILEEYQKKDKRIIIINKNNSGVSDTRNLGIDKAKGDYIMFIDADDYIEKNYIKEMINVANKYECDHVISGYTEVNNNQKKEKTIYRDKEETFDITYPKEFNNALKTFEFNPCWKQLVSRKLLLKNKIKFNKEIKYGEDMLFSLECYVKSKRTMYLKNFGYYYTINETSVMRKKDIEAHKKYYSDNKLTTELIIENYNLTQENIQSLYFKTLVIFNNICTRVVKNQNNYKSVKKIISEERKTYNKIFKKYKISKYGTKKQKIPLILLKNKLFFSYYLIKKYKTNN